MDASKIPEEGRTVVCPKCSARFHVYPEQLKEALPLFETPPEERIACPKCGCDQPKHEQCIICGIIIDTYRPACAVKPVPTSADVFTSRYDLRVPDKWYHDLFEQRLTGVLVRVLSLLLLIVVYVVYSINDTRRMSARSAIEVEVGGKSTAQRNAESDERFKVRFDPVVNGINANIDQCFNLCYGFLQSPWYIQGDNKPAWTRHRHILTESMQEEYNSIVTKKRSAATVLAIPTPSPRLYDCYYKIRHLSNLYDSLYKYIETYESYHYGFSAALSSLSAEHKKLNEELNACRSSL